MATALGGDLVVKYAGLKIRYSALLLVGSTACMSTSDLTRISIIPCHWSCSPIHTSEPYPLNYKAREAFPILTITAHKT